MPRDVAPPQDQLLGLIKKQLRVSGIQYSVYKAVTTNSKYLRLDKGLLGSLRIGDHPGKARYHYTYEIGNHIREPREVTHGYMGGEFTQYKFPSAYLDELITQIKVERANKISRYSKEQYDALVAASAR